MLKQGRSSLLLLILLLIALAILSGCAPRITGGELATTADESEVVIDLPAIVLDVMDNGQLSIGGQSLAELGALAGQDLSAASIPAEQVALLTSANIQHIQVANSADGLLILINGKPIPSLAWDGEKLVATAEVLQSLGGGVALLDKILPLIRNLGLGAIIRFPVAVGAESVPLVDLDAEAAEAARAVQQEFLAAVGAPPTFQIGVQYAEDGTWTVADMTQEEWSQLAPVPLDQLNLPPTAIQALRAAGIKQLSLYTNPDGIFIAINGQELPYITWAEGRVENVLALIEAAGLLGADPNMAVVMDTVKQLLPAVQASNVRLNVGFP
jgi:hypothetical protein